MLRTEKCHANWLAGADFAANQKQCAALERSLNWRRRFAQNALPAPTMTHLFPHQQMQSKDSVAPSCERGACATFVCLPACLSVCLHACTHASMHVCHLRGASHKGHVAVAARRIEKAPQRQLVGQKTRTLMPRSCREGSLRGKNAHPACCAKKLRMAQAQSFRAHTPGGFKSGKPPGSCPDPTGFVQQKRLR